jgi:hypothetical protein
LSIDEEDTMIWALLAILGVPMWLLVGVLLTVLWSRRSVKGDPDVIRMKERDANAEGWPRRVVYGRFVHDVLVIHLGPALVRTQVRGIAEMADGPNDGPLPPFTAPRVVRLRFDDGSAALLAMEESDAAKLGAPSQGTPT